MFGAPANSFVCVHFVSSGVFFIVLFFGIVFFSTHLDFISAKVRAFYCCVYGHMAHASSTLQPKHIMQLDTMFVYPLSHLIRFKRQFLGFYEPKYHLIAYFFLDHACSMLSNSRIYAHPLAGDGRTMYIVHLYRAYNWHKVKTLLLFLPLKISCVCVFFVGTFRFHFIFISLPFHRSHSLFSLPVSMDSFFPFYCFCH